MAGRRSVHCSNIALSINHKQYYPLFRLSKGSISLLLAAILLLAFALNLQLLDRFPLREDEALYSYWARHLLDNDPWMLAVWPDKPPIYLWMQAVVFKLFGATEASARLLNVAATTATTALLAATTRLLWGKRNGQWSAIVVMLLYALNPFTISFAATAYTDPILLLWGQLALYLVLRHTHFWAGVALGAAIMTKQQGLLYIPLIAAFTIISPPTIASPRPIGSPRTLPVQDDASYDSSQRPFLTTRKLKARISMLTVGIVTIVAPIIFWDSQRWAVAPSPWDLSVQNYGGVAIAAPETWLPRSSEWSKLLWYIGGSWAGWAFYVLLTILTIGCFAQQLRKIKSGEISHNFSKGSQLRCWADPVCLYPLLLTGWMVGFLLLHIMTTIQIWERYLLPLVPMLALLLGYGVQRQNQIRKNGVLTSGILLALLFPGAMHAARGGFPLGGDHGAYSGLTEAVEWLQQQRVNKQTYLPLILYQQPLGWQLQFYLYDETQQQSIDVRWFANAVTLADNAAKSSAQDRYLLQPSWKISRDLTLHLATRNLTLMARERFGVMTLFTIENLPRQSCTWCYCHINQKAEQQFSPLLWQNAPLVQDSDIDLTCSSNENRE